MRQGILNQAFYPMLPPNQRQPYQTLQALIQNIKDCLLEEKLTATQVQTQLAAIQHQFQQIMLLEADASLLGEQNRLRSIQAEMAKQFKLLSVDVMFLQAAKQTKTIQQREHQMLDRLQLLLAYCEAILNP